MQYVKIKEAIIEQIDSGALAAGEKLPAERKFADMFSTTRVTLREALSLLESEGRIYREDRRGWFISPEPLSYNISFFSTFKSMATEQGISPLTEVISAKQVLADKQITVLLSLPAFTEVYCIERVRYLDSRPVLYVKSYAKTEQFPQLLDADLTQSISLLYRQEYGIQYTNTDYKVRSTSLFGEIAQALRATSGTPSTYIEKIHYNVDDQAIACDIEYWRHDAICIESIAAKRHKL